MLPSARQRRFYFRPNLISFDQNRQEALELLSQQTHLIGLSAFGGSEAPSSMLNTYT